MGTVFEIRVEGELAAPTLHRLGCAHCVAGAQTIVRVQVTAAGLQQVLLECSEHGLIIEAVVRLDS